MDYTPLILASLVFACTSTTDLDNTGQAIGTCDCPWTQDDFISLTEELASLRTDVEEMKERMAAINVQSDQTNEIPEPDNVVGNIVSLDHDGVPTPPPRPAKIDGFIYATCKPMPNSVLTTEQFQPITGVINMKQNRSGGPLLIDVFMYGFQSPANSLHGFHIHTYGDLNDGCQSTGGHYNPYNKNHGGPNDTERHVGDLGNISPNGHGVVNIHIEDNMASLVGNHSIIGRAFVIHAGEDDLGRGGFPDSLTTGHAGARLACCVIGISEQ